MKTLLRVVFVLAVIPHALYGARTYKRYMKYYLDVEHAEEILGAVKIQPRLVDDAWLGIVGNRKNETYTVRPGDNLWKISQSEFGDAKLWRKLWEVNPEITNPHELTVGQILKYYAEGSFTQSAGPDRMGASVDIPMVKLVPSGAGSVTDLDADSFVNIDLKNKFHPQVILIQDSEILGEVTGAYEESSGLTIGHDIYVSFWVGGNAAKVGEKFSVVRFDRLLVDRTDGGRKKLGSVMRLAGEITIVGVGDKYVRARISNHSAILNRGDGIIAYQKPVVWSSLFSPPGELTTRIVAGGDADRAQFVEGDIVLLNKGLQGGMKDGYFFKVYRDIDLNTGIREGVDPSAKGEIQVVYAGEVASVGYVLRNFEPINIGDTLIPAQAFPAREAKTVNPLQPVEID